MLEHTNQSRKYSNKLKLIFIKIIIVKDSIHLFLKMLAKSRVYVFIHLSISISAGIVILSAFYSVLYVVENYSHIHLLHTQIALLNKRLSLPDANVHYEARALF